MNKGLPKTMVVHSYFLVNKTLLSEYKTMVQPESRGRAPSTNDDVRQAVTMLGKCKLSIICNSILFISERALRA